MTTETTDEKALFGLQEARDRFFPSVSMRQTRRYASANGVDGVRLNCVKIGAKRLVSRAAVDAFVAALFNERPTAEPNPRYRAAPLDVDAYSALDRLGVKWNKPKNLR